jgi:hypothetical protein
MPRTYLPCARVVRLICALSVLLILATSMALPQTRRQNSIVMDVDLTEQAAAGGGNALDIVGTIQLILDRIAAQTAPRNQFGDQRQIIWLPITADGECQSPRDTGILEVRVARFVQYAHQWIVVGVQHSEAQLSFQLLDCAGRVILAFPNNGATYASASFRPYYVSLTGASAIYALAAALNHSNNNNLGVAAVFGTINAYGPLQANVGAHDPIEMQELALFRLVGNIPGKNVPPPAPGTVSSLLDQCRFYGQPGGHIALECPSSVR